MRQLVPLLAILFGALGHPHVRPASARPVSPGAAVTDRSMEAGLPFIRNFSPKEYGAFVQNRAVVQDHRGRNLLSEP